MREAVRRLCLAAFTTTLSLSVTEEKRCSSAQVHVYDLHTPYHFVVCFCEFTLVNQKHHWSTGPFCEQGVLEDEWGQGAKLMVVASPFVT